jgi:hypothetical protein
MKINVKTNEVNEGMMIYRYEDILIPLFIMSFMIINKVVLYKRISPILSMKYKYVSVFAF